MAVAAVKQRDEDLKLVSSQLRELLENIEDEEQLNSALEVLDAAEERFAAQLEGHRPILTARESSDARPQSGSQALPEPEPAELRSSIDAKAADYAVGDLIDGRFEDAWTYSGRAGFRRSIACMTKLRTWNAR